VADTYNHAIRKITPAGEVTTLAGSPGITGMTDGPVSTSRFSHPYGVVVDSEGAIYVSDSHNLVIRKIASGTVTTLAGAAGMEGFNDGVGDAARFGLILGIAAGPEGAIYLADTSNHLIRTINTSRVVTTIAGRPIVPGSTDGLNRAARFHFPNGIAADNHGNVYVSDSANHVIRKISASGLVSTLAGSAGQPGSADLAGAAARFSFPLGMAADDSGNIYVADSENHTIRKITASGSVSTLAGLAGNAGTADGAGASARFRSPFAVALDSQGTIYVGDTWNHTIRKITPAGVVTTLAGSPGSTGSTDGVGAAARFSWPEGVGVDSHGNVYVADDGNHTVRKVTPDGAVTTLAGSPGMIGSADGAGSEARFSYPFGLAVDRADNIYVVDAANHTVRKITPAGMVSTIGGVAGSYGNVDGTGISSRFNSPASIAVDASGVLFVSDSKNHSIRRISRAIADYPVTDRPIAAVGSALQLDVADCTTTSWSWSITRYPATSSAALSSTVARNPTLVPDTEDYFRVRMQGSNAARQVAIRDLLIESDGSPPTLTLINPLPGQTISHPLLTLEASAADNKQVAGVWCQVNGMNWIPAVQEISSTHWKAFLPLSAGPNTLRAYAIDIAGNKSPTNSIDVLSPSSFTLRLNLPQSASPMDFSLEVSPGTKGQLQVSENLFQWTTIASFEADKPLMHFRDVTAPNHQLRFYRALVP
jgi:sugar lactone lactonase YvrE